MPLYRFHHHDGVVHHDADRQHQAEHAGDVDGETEDREQCNGSEHGDGNRQQWDQRRAPVLQEDEDHQQHQSDRFEERLQHVRDRRPHEHCGIVRNHIMHAGG